MQSSAQQVISYKSTWLDFNYLHRSLHVKTQSVENSNKIKI